MKHQAYSKFISSFGTAFKTSHKERTEEEYTDFVIDGYRRLSKGWTEAELKQAGLKELSLVLAESKAYMLWRYREVTHYFLEPGVADFCVSCVKSNSPEFCKTLPPCPEVDDHKGMASFIKNNGDVQDGQKTKDSKCSGGFAIHFPTKERTRSIVVLPAFKIGFSDSILSYLFAATDGETLVMAQPEEGTSFDHLSATGTWITKLVYGLSLYMDAFPDVVVTASGDSIHQIKQYSGERNILGKNEIVNEEHDHVRCPHWRRGHFHVLNHERFVHKRGMTVYVRGTFVKGKAFDVLDDAPPLEKAQ